MNDWILDGKDENGKFIVEHNNEINTVVSEDELKKSKEKNKALIERADKYLLDHGLGDG